VNLRDIVNDFDEKRKREGYETLEEKRRIALFSYNPEVLHSLVNETDEDILRGIAQNPATSLKTLEVLSNSKDWLLRAAVADNEKLSQELILKLSKDRSGIVRGNIIKNPKTPLSVLKPYAKLSLRNIYSIYYIDRSDIADHPNASPEILDKMARRSLPLFYNLRWVIASNENTSAKTLAYLAGKYDGYTKERILGNPNIDEVTLRVLINDRKKEIHIAALNSKKITRELVEIAVNDRDIEVRDTAIKVARKFI